MTRKPGLCIIPSNLSYTSVDCIFREARRVQLWLCRCSDFVAQRKLHAIVGMITINVVDGMGWRRPSPWNAVHTIL